tara:strand:+ start:533 stop:889 length:357 start_codon:yes stop_codon:yes gene_type:complete
MSFQIKRVGASLRVTDTTTGKIIISEPCRDVWYREERLQAGVIQFYDDNSPRQDIGSFPLIFLSDAVQGDFSAFDEDSFRLFVYENIGFNPAFAITNFASRVLALNGGFTVNNICYNG